MQQNIEELTLLLMYLNSWEEERFVIEENNTSQKTKLNRCWKGYDFETLNSLENKGYLFQIRHKSKSVTLTPEGKELAEKLMQKYIKQ